MRYLGRTLAAISNQLGEETLQVSFQVSQYWETKKQYKYPIIAWLQPKVKCKGNYEEHLQKRHGDCIRLALRIGARALCSGLASESSDPPIHSYSHCAPILLLRTIQNETTFPLKAE